MKEFHYGIDTDALDELDRLDSIAAFLSDAIGCISESIDHDGAVTTKCWQGLFYLSVIISDKISEIHSQCGPIHEDRPDMSRTTA